MSNGVVTLIILRNSKVQEEDIIPGRKLRKRTVKKTGESRCMTNPGESPQHFLGY